MRISYSALDAFETCPAKYKFQYLDRIKTPKSKEAVFGTLIHGSLKFFHDSNHPTPPLEDNLLKYFTQSWNSDLYEDKQEEAFTFHQGVDILKKYYLANQNIEAQIAALEMAFEAPIEGAHKIIGRIDRIDKLPDGCFEIIDYKTAKKMPSQESVDNNLQLFAYYLGVLNRWPFLKKENRPIKLSLYYLRHGEKLSTIQTEEKMEEKQEKIIRLIEQIDKSDFQPRINPLCDWCGYQPYCPLFRHKFIRKEEKVDEAKIGEIVAEFFTIKQKQEEEGKRLAELKGLINQYCDQNNLERIFGEEGYITRSLQRRPVYDFEKVKGILMPLGKWQAILKVDTARFNKLVASLPYQVQKQIEAAKKEDKEFRVISISRNKGK